MSCVSVGSKGINIERKGDERISLKWILGI
jgi:hypothetical protein